MKNDVLILKVKCFNLKDTLECGQCFRWQKEKNSDWYIGIIEDRVLKVKQEENKLIIKSSNKKNLDKVVKDYFNLDEDYETIENEISKIDENIRNAVSNTSGIRILNQNLTEMIISYIISANNNIPRISKSINEISKRYGKKVIFEDTEYFLFPTLEQLKDVSESDYKSTGVGFRAKYLKNTVQDILLGKINIEDLQNLETQEAKNTLLKLQGVGPKVADCILLFSCRRKEVFPIDVWILRVMNNLYFKDFDNIKKSDILNYSNENFGKYAGIVQQHLFHNIRNKMI